MERTPISVSMLSNYIKQIFDAESLLYNIDVVGEISSFGITGGNAFFVIKDENAILNCVWFGADKKFNIGDKVIVTGTPKYYVKGGKLNFNAVNIKIFGEGDLHKRFLELKQKLENEGLFDPLHKKPMPRKIDRIGVVTSETGAVIHDIINVVSRRNSNQDIVLFPIKVQGIGAEVEIARAIDFFSSYDKVDAIIVGRGGGSEEDLQNFNTEIVVRAIYNCKKFVISAVGHETDYTLCDFASDLRAPTPSAAAELLTKDRGERKQNLELLMKNITNFVNFKFSEQKLKLSAICDNLNSTMQTMMDKKNQEINNILLKMESVNPLTILKLGYAKVESYDEQIDSVKQLSGGQKIKVHFADGSVKATVDEEWFLWIMKKI